MLGLYKLITVIVALWILFIFNLKCYFPILHFLSYIYLKHPVPDFCFNRFAYYILFYLFKIFLSFFLNWVYLQSIELDFVFIFDTNWDYLILEM